ncbi:MAG: autotransporter outer membrane beta-barrel domain-containing protein, partial [Betaproteobacteria bacterium]|nr:autotransporter outer membrane beta-barrel domain-containing protein [Betaproteobacteria bacterium]
MGETSPLAGKVLGGLLSAPNARAAFDALSGEIHASAQTALIEDSRFVREAATDRLRSPSGNAGASSMTVAEKGGSAYAWGRAFGS